MAFGSPAMPAPTAAINAPMLIIAQRRIAFSQGLFASAVTVFSAAAVAEFARIPTDTRWNSGDYRYGRHR
jgi:hypothetical protein